MQLNQIKLKQPCRHDVNKKRNAISLEKAQKMIQNHVTPLHPVMLLLEDTMNCILAEDIVAAIDQPPFPRSPYDGYALFANDSSAASKDSPVKLAVVGKSRAGRPASVMIRSGQAVRIMTGGRIPDGADCVIPQEDTDEGEKTVNIYKSLSPYDNYCEKGEDFMQGTLLAKKGEVITSAVLAVAASAGYTQLPCISPVQAVVVSTGDELREHGKPLAAGQIYDSNGIFIKMRLKELGIHTKKSVITGDKLNSIIDSILDGVRNADILILTGGVSVGQFDLVPFALRELGAEILFHGVEIKPGMPALFAILEGRPVMALSGNPFAAAVSFEVLVRPALAALSGNRTLCMQTTVAKLGNGYGKKSPGRRFLRGKIENGVATIPDRQGNGQLRTMIGCNCLIEIPAGSGALCAGTEVVTHLL